MHVFSLSTFFSGNSILCCIIFRFDIENETRRVGIIFIVFSPMNRQRHKHHASMLLFHVEMKYWKTKQTVAEGLIAIVIFIFPVWVSRLPVSNAVYFIKHSSFLLKDGKLIVFWSEQQNSLTVPYLRIHLHGKNYFYCAFSLLCYFTPSFIFFFNPQLFHNCVRLRTLSLNKEEFKFYSLSDNRRSQLNFIFMSTIILIIFSVKRGRKMK